VATPGIRCSKRPGKPQSKHVTVLARTHTRSAGARLQTGFARGGHDGTCIVPRPRVSKSGQLRCL
jgi:hypothetical protein